MAEGPARSRRARQARLRGLGAVLCRGTGAHARITAASLGLDPRQYVAALPVHRLRELHVTGVGHDGQEERDHMPLREPDWELLTWTLDRVQAGEFARPWVVACEYGGVGPAFDWRSDPSVMADQFPRLAGLVRAVSART